MAPPSKRPFFTACGHAASPRAAFADLVAKLELCPFEKPGLCFLVATDRMAADLPAFIPDLAAVTGADDWVGTIGIGIMEAGARYIDRCALAVMITDIPAADYCLFPGFADTGDEWHFDDLQAWLAGNTPVLVWTHLDPCAQQDHGETLRALEDIAPGYVAGGVGSYRFDAMQVARRALPMGFCGVALSAGVPVATALATGIVPLGPLRTLAADDAGALAVLEGRRPVDCLIDDMRDHAGAAMRDADAPARMRMQSFLDGDIQVAVSHPQGDHAVAETLAITGINPQQGGMVLSRPVTTGMKVQFIKRNDASIANDLAARLAGLRDRAARAGTPARGGFFMSDLAYTLTDFGTAESDLAVFSAALGGVPMIGLYGSGAVDRAFVHRHSALAALFL